MVVTVHLHTILERHTPDGPIRKIDVNLPDGSVLQDVLSLLEINIPPEALLLVVNGRLVDIDHILSPGDRLNLMPAISGG